MNTLRAAGIGFLLLLAGCRGLESYRAEREEKAVAAMDKILARRLSSDAPLPLPVCIEIALRNNLDLEVSRLQEKIARERVNAEMLGMLPDLLITDDWSMRSNRPASASQSISTGGATFNYSQSSEKYDNVLKMELAFGLLDFGLAYFNTAQAQDRFLMEQQQLQRTAQNLTLQVARAYFRVAAAQLAVDTTRELLLKCEAIEDTIVELGESREVSPLRLFDEHRRFIQIRQRLLNFQRTYEDGKIELLSLLGLPPSGDIRLDVRELDTFPEFQLPPIEDMEKTALLVRPELYNMDMEANLILNESRKTLLMMLPNVRIFTDFTNSTNMFLYHSSWMELGVRAAFNLLRLPQHIVRYQVLSAEYDQMAVRQLSLSIGILSQVRIAHAQITEAERRYRLEAKNLALFERHLLAAEKSLSIGGALSQLELDRLRVETAESRIQRTIALGEYRGLYYQLLNAVGVENLGRESLRWELERFEQQKNKNVKNEQQ